ALSRIAATSTAAAGEVELVFAGEPAGPELADGGNGVALAALLPKIALMIVPKMLMVSLLRQGGFTRCPTGAYEAATKTPIPTIVSKKLDCSAVRHDPDVKAGLRRCGRCAIAAAQRRKSPNRACHPARFALI